MYLSTIPEGVQKQIIFIVYKSLSHAHIYTYVFRHMTYFQVILFKSYLPTDILNQSLFSHFPNAGYCSFPSVLRDEDKSNGCCLALWFCFHMINLDRHYLFSASQLDLLSFTCQVIFNNIDILIWSPLRKQEEKSALLFGERACRGGWFGCVSIWEYYLFTWSVS